MLSQRQMMILSAIVEDYVRSAEPVGSRSLSKHGDFQLSPATIRNEMSDLEELGFLDQPHTSAGRIPSQRGYRYYVDHLLRKTEIEESEISTLRELFRSKMNAEERVVQQIAVVLSELTQYTSIVLGPQTQQEKIKSIQIIPIAPGKAVAILVTDTGHVENRTVTLPEDIRAEDVTRIVQLLNTRLMDVPLGRLRSRLYREVVNEMGNVLEHYEDAIAVLDEISKVGANRQGSVYVGGATNILGQPEFMDVQKVRPLLELLGQSDSLQQVFPQGEVGMQVRIGQENLTPSLQDCTVISTTYTIDGMPVGTIGVLGPTRMNYARVMQILNYVSRELTEVMTGRLNRS